MLTFVFFVVPGYDHRRVMMRPQIITGQKSVPDLVFIMISFFLPFFWLLNRMATHCALMTKAVSVCFMLLSFLS